MNKVFYIFIGLIMFLNVQSQDNTFEFLPDYTVERNNAQQLIIYWENDMFLRTDYYFTNGAAFELLSNSLRWKPLEKFLKTPFTQPNKTYSLSIRQNMYTPIKMYSGEIEYSDRPYAGYLTSEYKVISESEKKRFTSSLTFGILGEHSLAGSTQNLVHSLDHLNEAKGWNYQVNNAPVFNLNYQLQQIVLKSSLYDFQYGLTGRLGTLYTDAHAATTLRIGKISSSFDHLALIKKNTPFEFYGFVSVGAMVSYHDATLQGSIINYKPNTYYIKGTDKHMFVYDMSFGLVAAYRFVRLKAFIKRQTPEFKGGLSHGWGGISVNVAF